MIFFPIFLAELDPIINVGNLLIDIFDVLGMFFNLVNAKRFFRVLEMTETG